MRLALVILVVLALVGPAAHAATPTPPATAETFSVEDARGVVTIRGTGIVIGRLDKGEIQVVDLSPLDQWSPRVNGVPRGRTVWTRGKDVNFYIPGGRYRITVRGEGFSISARGQGTVTLDGNPDVTGATGTYAIGDLDPVPLPVGAEHVTFGSSVAAKRLAPAKVGP
jgi:hypothetical protein